ncbi:hypothetical protein D7U74_18710 [Stenotrophomonas maltophilia]|nr:hypothetical protein [Stenotrophomonas maltophilia]MBA0223577.1 hypothetical protein [Stenotrophomonas maltophilia]
MPVLPSGLYSFKESLRFALEGADVLATEMGWKDKAYRIFNNEGEQVASGTIGEDGRLPRVMADGLGRPLTLEVGDDTWEMLVSAPGRPPENDGDTPDSDGSDPFLGNLDAADATGALTSEQILELLNEPPSST